MFQNQHYKTSLINQGMRMAYRILLFSVLIKNAFFTRDNVSRSVMYETTNVIECPRVCRCYTATKDEVVSDCSASNITILPTDISPKTRKLILSHNYLGRNLNQTLRFDYLTKLSYLDLSNNMLSKLDNQTFLGLKKLRYLSLAYNQLGHPTCLANGIFKPLVMLQVLQIQVNCQYADVSCTYHDTDMADLKSLRRLTLDGLPHPILGRGFVHLRELRYLSFYDGASCIIEITPRTFANLANSKLETLIIRESHVDRVLPGSFSMLKHLNTLDLSENDRLCSNGIKNISIGLNQTMIQMLLLRYTCKRDQTISNPLGSLRQSSLIHLDLSYNKIRNISAEFIQFLPKGFRFLFLQYNRIDDAYFLLFVLTMPSLEYLDVSGQNHYSNGRVVVKTHTQTTILGASDNISLQVHGQSSELAVNPLRSYSNLRSVILTQNLRSNNSATDEDGLNIPWPNPVPLPPKLRFLNVSYLEGLFVVSAINFSENNSLEILDISNGQFKKMKGSIIGLHKLKFLNLSHNDISYLSPDTFSDMPSLCDLNLSVNRFGMYINESASDIFSHLGNLTYLDMSDTVLKTLPRKIFSGNRLLEVLKLANNGFQTITFSLEYFDHLAYLDLSCNNIVFLQSETTTRLTSLSISHAIRLYLNGNSLKCNCDYKSFVDWFAHSSNYLVFSGNSSLKCTYISGKLINVSSLKTKWTNYKIDCVTWLVMTSCSFGFFVLLLVLSAAACIYRQRWKLRYLYYTGRKTINPYHPLLGERIDLEVDCYFSFDECAQLSMGDTREMTMYNFVTETIFPYLQQQQQARVSFRGALADNLPLYQTISQTIRCSKKVVVMLSTDYCKEYWNMFEFNMAAYEGMYTNRDVVVIVVIGDLKPQDLTGEVKAFIAGRNVLHLKPNCDHSLLLDQIIQRIS